MAIVIVNSTLPVRRAMAPNGDFSPIHYWGYEPRPHDHLLSHKLNRYEIVFRHRVCGGTDLRLLVQTLWWLARGATGVYCVTHPDLMRAVPLLKKLFPSKSFVTWIWTPREVREYASSLRLCDHVFSLTDLGLKELKRLGLAGKCSLGIWGCSPEFYEAKVGVHYPPIYDLLFLGLISRDAELVKLLSAMNEFTIAATTQSIATLGATCRIREMPCNSRGDLIRTIQSARATLVPLKAGDREPTGLTNVIESLLCGTAVVISDCSVIPEQVLSLPGVYRYKAGCVESCRQVIYRVLENAQHEGSRSAIKRAAAVVLNGQSLRADVLRAMRVKE